MPPIEADRSVPYAERRVEFSGIDEADLTLAVVRHPIYQSMVVPVLRALDAEHQGARGPARLYSAEELGLLLIYMRILGKHDYAEARQHLAGDRGAGHRAKLGFDRPRHRV